MAKFSGFIASIFFFLLASCGGAPEAGIVPAAVLEVTDVQREGVTKLLGVSTDIVLTIKNTGLGRATYMDAVALSSQFTFKGSLYPGTGGTCDKALAVDATCTVVVTFLPATVGTSSQTVQLSYNDGNETVTLAYDLSEEADNFTFQPVAGMLGGGSDIVRVIAPTIDGSGTLFVGGTFTTFGGVGHKYLVRIYADGTLDTRFNSGGAIDNSVYAVAPLADGKVYVGSSYAADRLVRLNSDGSKDTSFAATCDGTVNSIVPLNDGTGRIYVGGAFNGTGCNSSGAGRVARLEATGAVDTTFNAAVTNNTVTAIVLDSEGKLYVGGNFTTGNNRLVRLDSTGAVDTGFAIGSGMSPGSVNALALTTDGHIYVAGSFNTFNAAAANTYNRIIRLTTAGAVDPGFVITLASGFNAAVQTIAIAPDGTSVDVGGSFTTWEGATVGAYVRLLANGTPDPTVVLGTGFGTIVNSLGPAQDGSGELYVGGNYLTYKSAGPTNLARIRADGTRE